MRICATSGRVNQSGSLTPALRNSSRTWVPEMEAVRACFGTRAVDDASVAIDAKSAGLLGVGEGDTVWSVPR